MWPRSAATRAASIPAGPPPTTKTRFASSAGSMWSSPNFPSWPAPTLTVQPKRMSGPERPPMQPWLQPMQGRVSASRPSSALRTMSGSASVARTIETMSARPLAMMSSASAIVITRPVTIVGLESAFVATVLRSSS